MINKKEIFVISLIIIIISLSIGLSLNFFQDWERLLEIFISISLIILLNIFAKKIMAYKLDSEIEMRIWDVTMRKLRNPFPIGAFLPIITKILLFPLKNFIWMASLVFDVKPRIYRGAKRHGLYAFSEITEFHMGLIAASGIVINLAAAVVSYLLGFQEFSRLNIYYAFFNMFPLSELDGNKIFFGSKVLWSFIGSLVLIGLLLAMLIA